MIKIDYDRDCPPEVRAKIEPLLRQWSHVFPSWCREVFVKFSASDDYSLSISAREPYRDALFHIHPEWLTHEPDIAERNVIHELSHGITSPLAEFARGLIRDFTEEGSVLRKRCEREFKEAQEGVVEDLAWAIQQTRTNGHSP